MLPPDALLKGLAAFVVLAVGLVSLLGRRPAARVLALFLLLIAVNQGAEAVRASAADPGVGVVSFRIASVAAALDPFVLAWWVGLLHPRRVALERALPAIGLVSSALALYAGWRLFPDDAGFRLAHSWFTAVAYVGLLLVVAKDDGVVRSLHAPWLVGALLLVALRAAQRVVEPVFEGAAPLLAAAGRDVHYSYLVAPSALVVAGVAWAVLRILRPAPAEVRQAARLATAFGCALIVVGQLRPIVLAVESTLTSVADPLEFVGRGEASVRWLAFGALASAALLRSDALDFTVGQRRRAARVVIGLALVVTIGVGLVLVSSALGREVSLLEPLALALLVAVSQGFRRVVDATALRLYGVPAPGDAASALEVYRQAAAEVVARGGSPSRDPALQRARVDLGVDLASATVVERIAEESATGPLRPGQLVGTRYQVVRMLGRGGAARVFLAEDLRLERRVVLKEIFVEGSQEAALREARLAGALHHPRIAAVHDAMPRGDAVLIVQEYVEGGSLAEWLAGPRPPDDLVDACFRGVVEGAAAVHRIGVAHGDLKPANILLAGPGAPKLTDFGLARRLTGATVGQGSVLAGTPEFLAPERLRGGPPTLAGDVYALGLLGRKMYAGHAPPGVDAILRRALEEEPSARWASAVEMLAALPQDQ